MKYTICGYQQSEALKMVDRVPSKSGEKTIRIDSTDLVILRWFADFYCEIEKRIIEGCEYGWVKHGKILEDLPILDINIKSVNARMKKLVHFGLLDYKLVKENGNWSYYRFGPRYSMLIRSDDQTEEVGRSTDLPLVGQPTYPLGGQPTNKDSSIRDSSTKNNREGRFTPPTTDEVEAYAREKGYHGFNALRFVSYYESIGWKVGKNLMKSWKSAVTNWWTRDGGSRQHPQQQQLMHEIPDYLFAKSPEYLEMEKRKKAKGL